MGRFDSTKAAIDANIKKNDNQEITGSILNYVLNNMVDATESQLVATDARITEVSDALAEASSEIDALATEVESQNEMIEDLQNTKIDKEADDYYPQLSVGLADNLAGVDVVDSEVSFRRSGGGAISDGVARIEAIKGNSVVWNQKVRSALDSNGELGWWKRGNTQLSLDGNKIIMATGASGLTMMSQQVGFIENHKYLIAFDVKVVTELEAISLVLLQSGDLNGNSQRTIAGILQKEAQFASFYTASADMPYIGIFHRVYLNEGDTTTFDGIKVIDLTLMFGVGNEPTTIDEFNARKPLGIDENAYNEGEVIHMDAQSLESVGVNQWDEEWELGSLNGNTGLPNVGEVTIRSKNFIPVISGEQYYYNCPSNATGWVVCYDANLNPVEKHISTNIHLKYLSNIYKNTFTIPQGVRYIKFYVVSTYGTTYNHDICINLSDASINGKYFPYIKRTQNLAIIGEGLKSAGTAHDEIRYNKATQKWEKVQRIGSVDLGSLTWRYASTASASVPYDVIYTLDIEDVCKRPAQMSIANILSYKYITTLNNALADRVMEDKSIMLYHNGTIYIRDSSYTDAATFKAAMQGVMLYYELAEPIVTEIEDDFNLDYEVWNGGTEEVISDVPTSPLKADIAYGFNAVGKIKELEEKINSGGGGVSKDYVDGKLTELSAEVGEKQEALVSGENIKTINGESILGSGNITIQGGGSTPSRDDEMQRILAGNTPHLIWEDIYGKIHLEAGELKVRKGQNDTTFRTTARKIIAASFDTTSADWSFFFGIQTADQDSTIEEIYPYAFNDKKVTGFSGPFSCMPNVKDWSFIKYIDTSRCTYLYGVFNRANADEIDISSWDTSNVTSMECVNSNFFGYTKNVIGLENWDTSKVTSIKNMFAYTGMETIIGVSQWDIKSCKDFYGAFGRSTSLKSIDLSKWEISEGADMGNMFIVCSVLETIGLPNIPSNAKTSNMLNYCYALKNVHMREGALIYASLSLNESSSLPAASVKVILSHLAETPDEGATITFASSLYSRYTAEDKAEIDSLRETAKANGWTIVNMG